MKLGGNPPYLSILVPTYMGLATKLKRCSQEIFLNRKLLFELKTRGAADGEEVSVSLVYALRITDRPTPPPIRASYKQTNSKMS